MRALRASLIVFAVLSVASLLFFEAWQGIQSGVVSLALSHSRGGLVYTASRLDEPIAYYATLTILVIVAALILSGALLLARKLHMSGQQERDSTAHALVADIERRAPSGLKPLWVGLAIAVVCFADYVAAA